MAEITEVSPKKLVNTGGETITIKGSGFKKATRVYIVDPNYNEISMQKYTIDSDTQITAVSPKLNYVNYSYIYVNADGKPSTTPLVKRRVPDGDEMKAADTIGMNWEWLQSSVNRLNIEAPVDQGAMRMYAMGF
jgi:hypothetical protein